jgi:hypothetical protein
MSEHVGVAHMRKKYIKTYLGKLEGKQPFGRYKNWWKDNFKMDLEKKSGRVWTGILRLVIGTSDVLCVNTAMKLRVPLN